MTEISIHERKVKRNDVFQHFKHELSESKYDKLYRIIGFALNSETGEVDVIYEALYGDHEIYTRPKSMFESEVDKEKYPNIKQKYRFNYIDYLQYNEELGTIEIKHRKKVITLCGSASYKDTFLKVAHFLSICGYVVYMPVVFSHAECLELDNRQFEELTKIHLQKIDNSDEIMVLDVDGYIGQGTKNEIDYAKLKGKKIRYLSQENINNKRRDDNE